MSSPTSCTYKTAKVACAPFKLTQLRCPVSSWVLLALPFSSVEARGSLAAGIGSALALPAARPNGGVEAAAKVPASRSFFSKEATERFLDGMWTVSGTL